MEVHTLVTKIVKGVVMVSTRNMDLQFDCMSRNAIKMFDAVTTLERSWWAEWTVG